MMERLSEIRVGSNENQTIKFSMLTALFQRFPEEFSKSVVGKLIAKAKESNMNITAI